MTFRSEVFRIARKNKSPKFWFNTLLIGYLFASTTLAFLYLVNSDFVSHGFLLMTSSYQTNVNIQFFKSKDGNGWTGKVVDGSSKLKIAASKKEASGTNWVQILKEQNNLYEYPILRRINDLKVFYITAVASNTSKESHWDRVVINGWEPVSRDWQREPKYYCCFETDGRMELGEVVKKHTWGFRIPGVIAAVQFICSVPATARHKRVALTATPVCKEFGLKFVDIEYAFMQPDNTIGVCAKIAYGEFRADRILEWFEVNKEMGADHIVLFTYNLTKQARGVLDFYTRNGYLETKDFDFPMKIAYPRRLGQKYTLSWHDEQVVVFDCMERLQGYHYVAVLDLDEFLIPKYKEYYNWKVMLEKLSWLHPYASGFSFHTQIFTLDWGVSNPDGEFFISKFINRTRAMWDRRKNIVNPQKVVPGSVWTHGFRSMPGLRQENISSQVADIFHYRSCRSQWIKEGTCLKNRERHTDDTMLQVIDRIRDRLTDLRKTLLT